MINIYATYTYTCLRCHGAQNYRDEHLENPKLCNEMFMKRALE